ncbi:MAG: LamG-like jellyroll fold domain-containing protein [Promethearchaeota archaeon]
MTMKQKQFRQRIFAIFVLILTVSSVLLAIPLIPSNSVNIINEEEETDQEISILPTLSNGIGEDPWWNASYRWRQCINITNPRDYNLTDNFVSIEFDYTDLVNNYDMDSELYDVRIVENDIVRNYYVKKDFPSIGLATIWFETNSTSSESEYDTYMYWGNASINNRGVNHVNYDPSGKAWWSFEEGSGGRGSTVIDSLNFANATLWSTGSGYTPDYDSDSAVGSYSLNFDGSHDFVYINDEMNFTQPNEITAVTVSCWFKTFYTGSSYSSNWAFFDFDRSEYFNFYIDPRDGKIGFSTSANGHSGQHDFYGSNTGLNDGEWHFASVVYDGNDKIIYVDGVEDNRAINVYGGDGIGTTTDRWGFFGDGSEASSVNGGRNNIYYSGNIDEIRYFDYAVAPDEIEWLANYYRIETDLLSITERAASVTIVVEDVDGRRVPGAEVSLWDNLTHILEVGSTTYTEYTSSEGTVSFTGVPFAFYNITVNYTTYSGSYEEIVYDGRTEPAGEVEFKGLFVSANVTADLWTIDFEVKDWDGDPFNFGYINVSKESAIDVVDSIPLNSVGNATFRWLNAASYNYTIYYNNTDYYSHPTSLNASIINRGAPGIYQEIVTVTMSKLNIKVIDNTGTETVTGVKIKVRDNSTGTEIVELETDTTGYSYGDLTKDFGFWYLTGLTYNFSLWIVSVQQTFLVNTSDKPKPPSITPWYNYTLDQASSLVFQLDLNFTQRIANFTEYGGDSEVAWGENMSFWVLYETSNDTGNTWEGDWNRDGFPTSVTWTVYTKFGQKILDVPMSHAVGPTGNFTLTLNSNFLTAGSTSEFYFALVSGYKPFWNDPIDQYFGITVLPKSTGLMLYNYTSMSELPKNIGLEYEISEYYGYTINITANFYDAATNSSLIPDIFTYDWDYGSGTLISDPLHANFYYFELNTSLAANVGKYRIDITVSRENYSKIEDFPMYINIISRPTTINGSSGLLYISENIIIFEEKTFTFEYEDVFSSIPISNLDEKSYLLQKINETTGDPILGTTEVGELIETAGNKYILDLDTDTRLDGEYSIIVTLNKLNYEHRIAIISLTIQKRNVQIEWPDKFSGTEVKKIGIASGASLNFTITLTDQDSSLPVIGADVYLTVKGNRYNFTDLGNGMYSVKTSKIADAFFFPSTISAILTVEKGNFSTKVTPITIKVNMQETFGIPTFYLLMIVGAIVAITASLVIYRTVQQARIPTFVKKAKKMKKDIKGKKFISDSLLYPSKEEYMVKQLGNRWEMLGLSLRKVLGVEGKKKKSLTETPGEFKDLKGGVE